MVFSFQTLIEARALKNVPFCPIPLSDSNFNPRNTKCIPVVNPAFGGIVFLDLDQNRTFFKALGAAVEKNLSAVKPRLKPSGYAFSGVTPGYGRVPRLKRRLLADRSFNFVELKEGIHSDAGSRSFRRLLEGVGQEART
jgi:hypothetical protein